MRFRYFFLLLLFISVNSALAEKGKKKSGDRELQIVFCLDLSGSTNGLINDMRDNLWHIINQVSFLQPKPELSIGVVAFSRPSFKKENAYVKVLCDLTQDFDYLAAELSKIRPSIEKGDQFVGAALKKSVFDISWSSDVSAKKIIYMVGNGNVADAKGDYLKACEEASERNIIVNAIYVIGNNKAKEYPGWVRIANMGKGLVSEITLGAREIFNTSDLALNDLKDISRDFNLTFMYYSISGYNRYMNYRKSDSLAFIGGNASFYERVYYKSKNFVNNINAHWDLVDYYTKTGLIPPMNDSLYLPDSLKNRNNEYIYDMTKRMKGERQRASVAIVALLASDYPAKMRLKYSSGELKEDRNIFSRCIINMLNRQWN
jgi:hypothetical protein